jgi:hypothetical protein
MSHQRLAIVVFWSSLLHIWGNWSQSFTSLLNFRANWGQDQVLLIQFSGFSTMSFILLTVLQCFSPPFASLLHHYSSSWIIHCSQSQFPAVLWMCQTCFLLQSGCLLFSPWSFIIMVFVLAISSSYTDPSFLWAISVFTVWHPLQLKIYNPPLISLLMFHEWLCYLSKIIRAIPRRLPIPRWYPWILFHLEPAPCLVQHK